MSDYEGLEYLEPGFEPASLTVPRLRSIFVTHDITYPANAKKAQLLQIFEDEVKPKAKKILSVRARARRTSRGITDAESQDSTVTEENLEEEAMPPPPTPRTTRRKPSRLRSEEVELEPELPRARTRSPTKKLAPAKTRQTRTSDTNTSADPDAEQRTVRRVRKSEAPGAVVPVHKIKLEDSDDAPTVSKRRESAFTYDNPFQSGSSPLSESRSTSGERRRKSVGTAISTRKSTSSTRRKTDGPVPSTSAAFQIPISELESLKHVDENGVVASEEFTPEEQLEISQELAVKGVDALGPRRVKPQQRRAFNMSGPIWLAIVVLLGGYATWYSQEKFAVGYCGVGRDAVQVLPANVEVPDWLQVLVEPQCEPCPRHAQCFEKLKTECEGDYLLKQHPLALGGRIPIAPTCEPDGEKARKVKAVADKAVEELRERRAKFECGDLTTEAGLAKPTVKIDAEELKTEVSKKRSKKMGKAEFEELWAGAIGEIEGREEVTKTDDGQTTI
ncbi:putative Inner nuclear membrane protein HEH2 [Glarea lozoyensis 74030]|uniref:Putative Inner nuclear membrane protein HEH2 n=1 Tax=Glarea lozoyensis (strain ATCC 74030 / MF5533) TaxID=1104152 RepID=H0ECZ9_GLAL7|nr:putative Inner nuclear membrane protein HEH2 [Glarea lozoyensis 74030]